MESPSTSDQRREIPAVGTLIHDPEIAALAREQGRGVVLSAIRAVLDRTRHQAEGDAPADWVNEVRQEVTRLSHASLQRVINATGVVLHTNLGRAPLPLEVLRELDQLGSGYVNLEYDLAKGERGSRHVHAVGLLRLATGFEDALVVNNNAAAVMLVLKALAAEKEVIISRGELVEIGGSFRIPEILELSGARLREVGTTNRTRLADYEQAINSDTALILKVHPSNYRIEGFVESVSSPDLAKLAHRHEIPLVMDLGSALLRPLKMLNPGPPTVGELLSSGVDVVTFSGDKLLGGPQAGIILGRSTLLQRMRTDPWLRVVRVDKITLALLEGVIRREVQGKDPSAIRRLLDRTPEDLTQQAEKVAQGIGELSPRFTVKVKPSHGAAGGGSLPQEQLSSVAVCVSGKEEEIHSLEKRLRKGRPPVIARRREGELLFDMISLFPEEVEPLVEAYGLAAREPEGESP